MFFHGIDLKYLKKEYPFINPEASVTSKKPKQLEDRRHLVERFGFEPVHLLESTKTYPMRHCIKECLSFGDVILAYVELTEPFLQLSEHEIGVTYLDTRRCRYIFTSKEKARAIRDLGFTQPIIYVKGSRNKKRRP